MLEKIREGSQNVVAKGILVLVILSFAFAGISSYLGTTTEVPAATVNGEVISKAELEQAYQNERSRLQQQLGEMFDTLAANESYLKTIREGVLDRLVSQKLIDQAANKLGLTVSDEQIKQAILAETAFQTDGKFDNDRYQAILRQLGYQPTTFRNTMRSDMTRRQLINALVGSEFSLKSEATEVAKLQGQTRDIQYAIVNSEPLMKDIVISDEQVKQYYDDNSAQFVRPEMVSLDYVELNAADYAKDIDVTDEEAKTFYEEHKSQYQTQEKRLAAHILIQFGDDKAKAKAKAEAIEKQLEGGANFADLAKKDSEDTFSAKEGGKLDWYEQGVMEPAFDKALFALKKGQQSKVVETDFGFHIIKLLDVKPSTTEDFSKVKSDIIAEIKAKHAEEEFYDVKQTLADTSYEQPDSLVDAAKAVNAQVKHTVLFSRNSVPSAIDNPQVIKAAFSDEVLQSGLNSEVIELGDNHVMVLRVNEHKVAGTKSFDEVKNDIVNRLKLDKANELAETKAQELAASVKAGKSETTLTTKKSIHRFDREIENRIVDKAFQMATVKDGVSVDTVALTKGYAVVVLNKVNAAVGIDDTVISSIQKQLANKHSELDYQAITAYLKAQAEISYAADLGEQTELR
ncbi:MAG: SurA N-terminal domain-containing protein [Parashewanella sp.]